MTDWLDSLLDDSLVIPEYPNYYNLSLDPNAIEGAINMLHIENRVQIKWSSGTRLQGAHRWKKDNGGYHGVTLSRYHQDRYSLSDTLWHELVHARQSEKAGNPAEFYTRHYKDWGVSGSRYWNNPYEVQARKVAGEMVDKGYILGDK